MILETGTDNSRLAERLERLVREGRISHAYIFEGPSDIDKEAFARGFIKGVLCPKGLGENCGMCSICSKIDHGNHEDITYFQKDGMSVKDAAIMTLQEKIKVRPTGDRNVFVISDCDTMTPKAQNSLLKTLEEPPGDALIILLSENMENLTPTILSRCVKDRQPQGHSGRRGSRSDRGNGSRREAVPRNRKGGRRQRQRPRKSNNAVGFHGKDIPGSDGRSQRRCPKLQA